MPQNSVTSIVQTPDGYLWLATFNGLARFDGARFTVFDQGNVPALPSSRLIRLDVDHHGGLWIITEDGALLSFRHGEFKRFSAAEGFAAAGAAAIVRGPKGRLLLVDRAGGVSWLEGETWNPDPQFDFLRGNRVSLLADDEDQKLWAWNRSKRTLGRIADGQMDLLDQPGGTEQAQVRAYARAVQGGLWLVLSNQVWRFQGGSTPWKRAPWVLPDSARGLMHMLEDREGNVWLATYGNGLLRFDPAGTVEHFMPPEGLSHNAVRSLFEDREGNLWIGTDGGGLNRLKRRTVNMWGVRQGLSAPVVMSLAKDPQHTNTLWLGLNGGGINRLASGQITSLVLEPMLTTNSFVYGLLADRQGALWIGTYDHGIFRCQHGALTRLAGTEGWGGRPLLAVLEDRAGAVWLGGGFGLCRWENGVVTEFNSGLGESNVVVRALAEDGAGNLFVGTVGSGLKRYSGQQWTHYSVADGLPNPNVSALYADRENTLWIGMMHGGLSRFSNGRFCSFATREGLPANYITAIVEDQSHHLWFGSNRGIFRVPKAQLIPAAEGRPQPSLNACLFGVGDGLSTLECGGGAQPAACATPDGKLWFATVRGLAMIDPAKVPFNLLPPPVVIEEVLLDDRPAVVAQSHVTSVGRTARAGTATADFPDAAPPPSRLTVAPGKHRLDLHFTGLSLVAPEKMRFRYRLQGLDEGWVEAGPRRAASYAYIPPGKYRFEVTACNNDGVWNNTGASMMITVLPPWWMTWWFRITAVLGAGTLVSGLIWLRWRELQHERAVETAFAQRLIGSQEEERQRIAAELHDSIGQDLLVIKNRALLGLRETGGQANPTEQLKEISHVASQSLDEVREISRNLRPYQIDRLGLTKAIEVMAAAVFGASGLRCTVELQSVDGLLPPSSEIHLYRVIQELLNNIIKHSDASEAVIRLTTQRARILLTAEDDGRGFDYGAVFGRPASEHGLGLTDIAERVRILGGKLQCDSRPGKGTRWQIKIPVAERIHEKFQP